MSWRRLLLAVVAGAVAGSGCGVGYLLRAGWGEARVLLGREPIAAILARTDVDAGLAARLQLVLGVRRFAEHTLGLRVGDAYASFAAVDGEATVWVVSAARRDRLEPYTWWYPIVGRLPYRGYFARADADAYARTLERKGFDVDVREAAAFSTLGWFADPLLSTTARAAPVPLAETVLHELFHATLFVPGAAAFNESAATFVGHRGAIVYFCAVAPDADACRLARRRWQAVRRHGRVVGRYATRLRTLYATQAAGPALEARRGALARRAGAALERHAAGRADELFPPNNARLLGMLVYETDLDVFERVLAGGPDLPDAIRTIVAAARDADDPFVAVRALGAGVANGPARIRLDDACSPSPSPSTRCSGAWPGGCASSGTTRPTARTCTGRRWRGWHGARAG